MMEIVETEHFYQIKATHYRSNDFIKHSLEHINALKVFVECTNDIGEKIGLEYDLIDDAIRFITETVSWTDLCVTVLKW